MREGCPLDVPGRSACGGLLPAPAEQTQSGEAGGEEREGSGERHRIQRGSVGVRMTVI